MRNIREGRIISSSSVNNGRRVEGRRGRTRGSVYYSRTIAMVCLALTSAVNALTARHISHVGSVYYSGTIALNGFAIEDKTRTAIQGSPRKDKLGGEWKGKDAVISVQIPNPSSF